MSGSQNKGNNESRDNNRKKRKAHRLARAATTLIEYRRGPRAPWKMRRTAHARVHTRIALCRTKEKMDMHRIWRHENLEGGLKDAEQA